MVYFYVVASRCCDCPAGPLEKDTHCREVGYLAGLQEIATPIGMKPTRGAWYRTWRIVNLDGGALDVADNVENAENVVTRLTPKMLCLADRYFTVRNSGVRPPPPAPNWSGGCARTCC